MPQVQKLRNAIQEYENDRWRIISGKVGNGFSAAACKDKSAELDDEDAALVQQRLETVPEEEAEQDEPETS